MTEAKKPWVPKVGDRVRIKHCWLRGLHAGLELVVTRVNEVVAYTEPHRLLSDGEPAFRFADIEPVACCTFNEGGYACACIRPKPPLGPVPERPREPAAKADPYEQHRKKSPSEAAQRASTDLCDEVQGRRARLIAALAQDLRRPAPVRFPHPGRNFELKGSE
jgi:hypothetical protein